MTQLIGNHSNSSIPQSGRVGSAYFRQTLADCESFAGLENGVDRYQLLLLVKKVGKRGEFTPRMIQLLDYYMAFTRDVDWEQGGRPIVYQSLAKTALDLGVSERQIQKLEQRLFHAGAITWNDSGNHKRYGQRHPDSGRIMFAYGVELTPLAYLANELEEKLQEKELYDAAWLETKRQISWYRRQILAMFRESEEQGSENQSLDDLARQYDEIAIPIRTYIELSNLRTLWDRHKSLHSALIEILAQSTTKTDNPVQHPSIQEKTDKGSSRDERKFIHYKSTTQPPFNKLNTSNPSGDCLQESVADRPRPTDKVHSTGLEHVTLKNAIAAASQRFQDHLPENPRWNDFVEAAYAIRRTLGISQQSWGDACHTLGRTGAAMCVLITDQASQRTEHPVRKPAAYFHSMHKRSKQGKLHLHKSIFGLLPDMS